ncbi:hypothetical protein ACFPME_01075 [Rhodanobacter umsongensis]|uniref:Uncharacterized protein n=1 Tax=Rhodanobacter umsongensis TaxID=633153 RepID=A0ABW0JGS6_9GAMM
MAKDAPHWYETMLTSSMPIASASGAVVERDDMSAAAAGNKVPMMPADVDETRYAGRPAAIIADSI